MNRSYGDQKMYYNDIEATYMPSISVLIPMHNEEKVLHYVLDSLLKCDYDSDKIEIIPINDNSTDRTKELLDEYASRYPIIKPLHRKGGVRGKPAGLNDAMEVAKNEIAIIFDADYRPGVNLLNVLAAAFIDPKIGAVMGRVVPYNTNTNMLTRLLNMERTGGYQADQQARYNMGLIPQYGGTTGAFRRELIMNTGGFNVKVLAEDTEITMRLYTKGYKVAYANMAECYEEVPETWNVRSTQIRRWSRGHNTVMFKYMFKMLFSKHLKIKEKIDGFMLLLVYAMPFILLLAQLDCIALFFYGEMNIFVSTWTILFIGIYNSFGNFAPFYEIATAAMMDGTTKDVFLLPLLSFNFYFYMYAITMGFLDALGDLFTGRTVMWAKTQRFIKED
jgi:cellulose synthase/poly-beta-1,6-N-acetylglucosamine synthase-like glycosyltransferase